MEKVNAGTVSMAQPSYFMVKQVIPNLESLKPGDHLKLMAVGYMDLNIDCLHKVGERMLISMAHNFVQHGDVIADPDMGIIVDFEHETVMPTHCQMDLLGSYKEPVKFGLDGLDVYQVDKEELCSQMDFLHTWLINLICQGHK